jgi:hypothetical protein
VLLISIVALMKFYNQKRQSASQAKKLETPDSNSNTATQTLVTQILKISLPGYKEVEPIAFRLLRKLAEGGGGSVHVGEALSAKCATFGKVIIIKQIAGKP